MVGALRERCFFQLRQCAFAGRASAECRPWPPGRPVHCAAGMPGMLSAGVCGRRAPGIARSSTIASGPFSRRGSGRHAARRGVSGRGRQCGAGPLPRPTQKYFHNLHSPLILSRPASPPLATIRRVLQPPSCPPPPRSSSQTVAPLYSKLFSERETSRSIWPAAQNKGGVAGRGVRHGAARGHILRARRFGLGLGGPLFEGRRSGRQADRPANK